jgi:hypothetical protein
VVHFYKVILFISLIFTYPAFGLTVSVSSVCSDASQSYNFDSYDYNQDLKIRISSFSYQPDYVFEQVLNKDNADIVIEDNADNADYVSTVCISKEGKTIKMLNYEFGADLIVTISNNPINPDFTIFYDSQILSLDEAIAISVLQEILR